MGRAANQWADGPRLLGRQPEFQCGRVGFYLHCCVLFSALLCCAAAISLGSGGRTRDEVPIGCAVQKAVFFQIPFLFLNLPVRNRKLLDHNSYGCLVLEGCTYAPFHVNIPPRLIGFS